MKVKSVQEGSTEYNVTILQHGVLVSFMAKCPNPQKQGTGNHWEVDIYDILSDGGNSNIRSFFEEHELISILKYDLQDWSRENLEIDLDTTREEELQEILHSNFNSY